MSDDTTKPKPQATIKVKKVTGGALGTAALFALAMAVAQIKIDEGKRNITYADLVGVPTACWGHTGPDVKAGQRKTDAECEALLTDDAQAKERAVLKCTPGLAERPYQLAAATRLTFNIGEAAYCRSTVARRFNAGDWRGACDAMLAWKYAGGRVIPGLLARRQRERAMCLEDL
jgi:lysozyme